MKCYKKKSTYSKLYLLCNLDFPLKYRKSLMINQIGELIKFKLNG